MTIFKNNLFYSNACERAMNIRGFFIYKTYENAFWKV